jgi:hypothetical protein
VRQVKQTLSISDGEAGRLRLRAAAEGLLEAGTGRIRGEEGETALEEPYRLD